MKNKRTLSPEHLAKLQAGRAKKLQSKLMTDPISDNIRPDVKPAEDEVVISRSDLDDLKRQIEEIKKSQVMQQPQQQTPQFSQQGNLIGVFEKYVIDPANYPDPSDRLAEDPGLKRYRATFKQDYFPIFKVETSEYPTVDGRRIREPKFTLELWANRFTEEGDLLKNDLGQILRFRMKTFVWHEDPQAAIVIARENGIDVKEWDDSTIDRSQKAFLDEMRYLRIRDMLVDAFFPKVATTPQRMREEVIGNQLVEVRAFATEASAPTLNADQIG